MERIEKRTLADAEATADEARRLKRGRLITELGFSENDADRLTWSELGTLLLDLKDEGVTWTEEDPLLLIALENSDTTSLHYYHHGNFGLPANTPGSLPWPSGGPPAPGAPLPPGVDAVPDRALGKFIAAQPGLFDMSGGKMIVFRGSMSAIEGAREALLASRQFRRLAAPTASLLGVPVHPPLAHFYLLQTLNGPPTQLRAYNIA